MTREEIEDLTEDQAKELLYDFYSDEYKANMYLSLTAQMNALSKAVANVGHIDIKDKEFKQVLDTIFEMTEKGSKMTKSMDEIKQSIDKEFLEQKLKEQTKSREGSVESLVKGGFFDKK